MIKMGRGHSDYFVKRDLEIAVDQQKFGNKTFFEALLKNANNYIRAKFSFTNSENCMQN